MKNLSAACFIILVFAGASFAKLMPVPLDEALLNSDLIVVGTLQGISERTEEYATYGKGEILVEQFISGKVLTVNGLSLKNGDKLELSYLENFACVMGSHRRIENKKGVFLLTLDDDGKIQSEDFRSLESLTEIRNLLKKGIETKAVFKTIKTQNDIEQTPAFEKPEDRQPEISFGIYDVKRKVNYRLISAFGIIFISLGLYYLLYRSRFKIR